MEKKNSKENNIDEINYQKYVHAGAIANDTLKQIIEKCVEGAKISELCEFGDNYMITQLEKIYTKKEKGYKISRGICLPVTININEICSNYAPIESNETIKNGDLVKISLGCHIDGHIGIVGHTICVNKENENIEKEKAEVLKHAHILGNLFLRILKVGSNSNDITETLGKAIKDINCTVISNCISHQIKKYILEGSKYILLKENPDAKSEKFDIEEDDTFVIDIMVTNGEGKMKATDLKPTIFKRDVQVNYQLKTNLSRNFMNEVNKKFPIFPFNIRSIEDKRSSLIGVPEACRHKLIIPYDIHTEQKNKIVAQFKYTVMVKKEGIKQFTGIECSQIDKCIDVKEINDEDLKKILNTSIIVKKRKDSIEKNNIKN